jgi:hypothetical protein
VKRIWTIIGVRDVPRSFAWYQSLFGQRATAPAHPDFDQKPFARAARIASQASPADIGKTRTSAAPPTSAAS